MRKGLTTIRIRSLSTIGTTSGKCKGNRLRLSDLKGLIPDAVGEVLAGYAAQVPEDQAIVEIGSYKGKSTCYLASEAKARVYAVDPWGLPGNVAGRFGYTSAFPEFMGQITAMGYEGRITPIQDFGHLAGEDWTGPVGLLFVDGDHSARSVEQDVKAWLPHLVKGAVLILDDLDTPKNPGVRVAAERLARRLGPFTVEAERLAVWRL